MIEGTLDDDNDIGLRFTKLLSIACFVPQISASRRRIQHQHPQHHQHSWLRLPDPLQEPVRGRVLDRRQGALHLGWRQMRPGGARLGLFRGETQQRHHDGCRQHITHCIFLRARTYFSGRVLPATQGNGNARFHQRNIQLRVKH